jgi:hypothetical protein
LTGEREMGWSCGGGERRCATISWHFYSIEKIYVCDLFDLRFEGMFRASSPRQFRVFALVDDVAIREFRIQVTERYP